MKAKIIDETVMSKFYEKDGRLYWKNSNGRRAIKDNLVGFLDKRNGYYVVKIGESSYLQHRILYQIYNNVILGPDDVIDHIDRDKTNNRKDNLRKGPHYKNCMNRTVGENNKTTGLKNISICNSKNYKYYKLKISYNKNTFLKYFRIDKFTIQEVLSFRNKKLLELHGTFACYD